MKLLNESSCCINVCLHSHFKVEEDNGYCSSPKHDKTVKRERDDDEYVMEVFKNLAEAKKPYLSTSTQNTCVFTSMTYYLLTPDVHDAEPNVLRY